jgi:hypothetical protein
VNIRTHATQSARVAGNTNVVSDRFVSRAIFCIVSSSMPDASGNTASALPSSGWRVKTSTMLYRYDFRLAVNGGDIVSRPATADRVMSSTE